MRRFGRSRETVRFGHVDAKLEEFPMDSRGAPERVRAGQSCNQRPEFWVDWRTTSGRPAGELGPVLAESAALPPEDSVGGHEHEGLPPAGPDPGQSDPEESIRWA